MTRDRAAVQRSASAQKPAGWVEWWEHELAWQGYRDRYGSSQTAVDIAERGGFSYGELTEFLGHEPTTWVPR